jgi:hypothetical protein
MRTRTRLRKAAGFLATDAATAKVSVTLPAKRTTADGENLAASLAASRDALRIARVRSVYTQRQSGAGKSVRAAQQERKQRP